MAQWQCFRVADLAEILASSHSFKLNLSRTFSNFVGKTKNLNRVSFVSDMKSHGCGTSLVVNQFYFHSTVRLGTSALPSPPLSFIQYSLWSKNRFHSMVSYYGHSAIAIIHKWRTNITRARIRSHSDFFFFFIFKVWKMKWKIFGCLCVCEFWCMYVFWIIYGFRLTFVFETRVMSHLSAEIEMFRWKIWKCILNDFDASQSSWYEVNAFESEKRVAKESVFRSPDTSHVQSVHIRWLWEHSCIAWMDSM